MSDTSIPGTLGEVSWERMIRAVENVRERLLRALIDDSWLSRIPQELGLRLQQLLDNPDG